MKIKILSAFLLTFALLNAVFAQTPDKAKLDLFFDRLAEKKLCVGLDRPAEVLRVGWVH